MGQYVWDNSSWVQEWEHADLLLVSLLIRFTLPVTIVTTSNSLGFFCPHLTSRKESSRALVSSFVLTYQFLILDQGSHSDSATVGPLLNICVGS
jgi:hypothetical protein